MAPWICLPQRLMALKAAVKLRSSVEGVKDRNMSMPPSQLFSTKASTTSSA
jgi:hypothetical protein